MKSFIKLPALDFSRFTGLFSKQKKAKNGASDEIKEVEHFVTALTGAKPRDTGLFVRALTHKSLPGASGTTHNERLEFLGDSVLHLIVTDFIYRLYPDEDEGSLSQLRSYLTSRNNLNGEARRLGLDKALRTAAHTDLVHSDIPGNTLEAFVGALFLDRGIDFTSRFVQKQLIISRKNLKKVSEKEEDFKTEFIILMQKHKIPYDFEYLGTRASGKGLIRHCFRLRIGANGYLIAEGDGSNKKAAHQAVSRMALETIALSPDLLSGLAVPAPEAENAVTSVS